MNVAQEQLHFAMVRNVTCKLAMTIRATIGQIKVGPIGLLGVNVLNRVMVEPESADDFVKISTIAAAMKATMKLYLAMTRAVPSTLAEKN